MESHTLNVAYELEDLGRLVGYFYYLDFDPTVLAAVSTSTLGARFKGSVETGSDTTLRYTLEYAIQEDAGDNPIDVDADYYLAEAGASFGNIGVDIGWEVLGGDATGADGAFTTPLATLHAFNGFADQFLTTPATGLVDEYVTLSTNFGSVGASFTYHEFEADMGGTVYADEFDATLVYPYSDRTNFGVKFAYFDSHVQSLPHTTKLMVWMTFKVL